MPDNKKDVYKILDEMKKKVLGISDQKPHGIDGMLVSFLPTGQPINPDDFKKPWKPNMTNPNKAVPPPQPGTETVQDNSDIAKRYETLANTCTLVDSKIKISDVYTALDMSAKISQAWDIIVTNANAMELPPAQEALQKKQRDKYLPRLRKTIKDEDGSETDVNTKEYKTYREYEEKYHNALRKYATQYLTAMSNSQTAQTWGVVGNTYVDEVTGAWDEWMTLGHKQFIEDAIANLAAMGTDATARMIDTAKKKFKAYRIATQGVIPDTSQYVELFPSNWCELNVENDGWTNYEYSWKKEVRNSETESNSYSASGGISFGFWRVNANVNSSNARQHSDRQVDGLEVRFKYALIDIHRPWLDTLLFDLGNWFLVGDYKKGAISNGKMDQVMPDSEAGPWLPIIPKKLIVIKDLVIKTNGINDEYNASQSAVSGGGGFGFGFFNLGGKYSHSKSNSTWMAEQTDEGLSVKGIQIIGWVSSLVQMSPKMDSPKDSEQPTQPAQPERVAEPIA